MSDLKLFRIVDGVATELPSSSVALERSLQKLIEANMEAFFGVRLLASEFSTGIRHGGRMDSLGIEENGSPVIFEYNRAINESVITRACTTSTGSWPTGATSPCWSWRSRGPARPPASTGATPG